MPVEVGPPRGQPDQHGRTGGWGAYPGGELGGGFDLPLSRHLAFKHTPVPSFSGLKPEFNPWTRNAVSPRPVAPKSGEAPSRKF
ncbi:MAG: hypothetical protein ABJZ69_09975, partial [Hyphomicrobiales bacterium]